MSGDFPSKRYAGPSPPLKSDNFFQFSYLTMSRIEKKIVFKPFQKKLSALKGDIFFKCRKKLLKMDKKVQKMLRIMIKVFCG